MRAVSLWRTKSKRKINSVTNGTHTKHLLKMDNNQYHADTTYIGKSGLDIVARSPAHYWARYLDPNRVRKADTPALIFGSLLHAAILEPHTLPEKYAIVPSDMNKHKKEWGDFKAAHTHKIIVDADDMQAALAMRAAAMRHPQASALLTSSGDCEKAIFATDPETGALLKIKPDRFNHNGIMLDVKTTEDARADAFAKSVHKYRYHVQDAFYTDVARWAGHDVKAFVFIAIEKEPPYAVAVWWLDEEARERGRSLYRDSLNTYAKCLATNDWHAYQQQDDTDIILTLPKWALTQ